MPSGTLKVRVVSAKNLPGEGDYVVKISVGKNKSQKTKSKTAKKNALNPEWNETLTFTLENEPSINADITLVKTLGNKDVASFEIGKLDQLVKSKEKIFTETDKGIELVIGLTPVDFGISATEQTTTLTSNAAANSKKQTLLPPMPSADEVNRQYDGLMAKLGLGKEFKHPTSVQTKAMVELSLENKWAMICQSVKIENTKVQGKIENTPQYWTNKLKAEPGHQLLRDLRIVVGGESLDWLQEFISLGGLGHLLEVLGTVEHELHRRSISVEDIKREDEQLQMQFECIRCLQVLMNNKTGLTGAINTENGIKKLALCLDIQEDYRLRVVKLLTLICLVPPNGHRLVVDGLTAFRLLRKEKMRFQELVRWLKEANTLDSKLSYLTFINSIINSPFDIDLRCALRQEFIKLGITEVIEKLKKEINPETDIDLETQIDVFDEEANDDYKELHDRFADLDVNVDDVDDVFKTLKVQYKKAGLSSNFLGALQNFLIIPTSTEQGLKTFLLVCRVIRQISLNKESVGTSEESHINLAELLTSVDAESKEVPLNKKIQEIESVLEQNSKEMQTFKIEIQEKNDQIERLKAQLASGGGGGGGGGSGGPPPPPPPGGETTEGGGPPPPPPPPGSDGGGGPPPPPPPPGGDDGGGGPPPPPPPPGGDGGGPPPPPPPFGGPPGPPPPGGLKKVVKKKPLKSPASKMKGFQWTKLPPNKLKGTIFETMAMDYKGVKLDYKDLEEKFSAKIIEKKEKAEEEKKISISILDPKTSQNLSIFLSQFKTVAYEDICKGIQTLNTKMFTLEQLKNLLLLIPSKDDMANIQNYIKDGGDASKLPNPEKFAIELEKIPRLDERLKGFIFRMSFETRKADIKPGLETLKQASKQVHDSKKLPQMFELVLEIGNFLNDNTPRGNSQGFKLGSLMKMVDTKTTDNTTTLLQYLVIMLENASAELLNIGKDFPDVEAACRVSLTQLAADVNTIQKDFNNVQKFIESFTEKDRWSETMTTFLAKTKDDLEQIDASFKVLEERYNKLCEYLGEDPKTMQPEELFGNIQSFVNGLQEAKKQNENAAANEEKNKRREEAKQKRQADLDNKKGKPSGGGDPNNPNPSLDNVVEELFGALKGGDIFKNRRLTQQQQKGMAPIKNNATVPSKGFQLPPPTKSASGGNAATLKPTQLKKTDH